MPIDDAPAWIKEFLTSKAPWWLDCQLEVLYVQDHPQIARVKKDGQYTYTLIPERYSIV